MMNDTPDKTKTRTFRVMLALSLTAITYLALTPGDYPVAAGINDKLNHMAAFAVLAWLTDFSFPGPGFNLKKSFPLFLYGVLIEVIQYFLPNRFFSLWDILADISALFLYKGFRPLLLAIPFSSYLKIALTVFKKGASRRPPF